MIKKYILTLQLIILGLIGFGQSTESVKMTEIKRDIGSIHVKVIQFKSLVESPDLPLCRAKILIFKNNIQIDSIVFNEIEAVGGQYGLLTYSGLIKNHIIVSKYGDYDGETIIINAKGEKFITIGGYSFVDNSSGFLFSILDSDLSGFSVFDLNNDKEIFKKVDIEDRPQRFYKTSNNGYLFQAINDETEKITLWEIKFNLDKIIQTDYDINKIKYGELLGLSNYDKISIDCE